MANEEHLAILRQGVERWNRWRAENPSIRPDFFEADLSTTDLRGGNFTEADVTRGDLSGANLSGAHLSRADLTVANLSGANLSRADLSRADLSRAYLTEAYLRGAYLRGANLSGANLSGANLSGADLSGANLSRADLSRADLTVANLSGANLSGANLSGANLSRADLEAATLVDTNLTGADLSGCRVFGISAWRLCLENTIQDELMITAGNEPTITVDSLEIAQFIYLLLNNERIRHVIDSITSKVVLILGRFTPDRKQVLDRLREELRKRDYLPILFDFTTPSSRSTMETVSTLAHMSRFVIADLTDAKSVLQELRGIVPELPSVPVQPLLLDSDYEPGMVDSFKRYPWFLEIHRYRNLDELLVSLETMIISPAEGKARELTS